MYPVLTLVGKEPIEVVVFAFSEVVMVVVVALSNVVAVTVTFSMTTGSPEGSTN